MHCGSLQLLALTTNLSMTRLLRCVFLCFCSCRSLQAGQHYASATDAAALGPHLWGPAPWCLGRLFCFARYTLRLRIQQKRHISFIVNKECSRQNQRIASRTLAKVLNSRVSALLYICALPRS